MAFNGVQTHDPAFTVTTRQLLLPALCTIVCILYNTKHYVLYTLCVIYYRLCRLLHILGYID